MTEQELGNKLKKIYGSAPKGDVAVHIHLFGIKYADEIKSNNYRLANILEIAGLSDVYRTELNKGIKLAKYVELKTEKTEKAED